MTITLHHGDCLDIMPTLPDRLFDAIIADLPYGTTACKWDNVIPFVDLWIQYKRLIKRRGAVVLFGNQPFTSALVMSNIEWFRYSWVWFKNRATRYLDCNRMPLKACEDICVFSSVGYHTYNPVMREGAPDNGGIGGNAEHYQHHKKREMRRVADDRYPINMLQFPVIQGKNLHPTQKPIALLEYLIRTYTNPGDIVLDNTMGSGTTMVACVHTGRNGIGIEKLPVEQDDPDYFGRAQARVETAQTELIQLALI